MVVVGLNSTACRQWARGLRESNIAQERERLLEQARQRVGAGDSEYDGGGER
jgi:hypothetical protein